MIPETEDRTPLSQAGAMRREQMLHELLADMNSVHRHRRVRRTLAIAGTPLLAICIGLTIWRMTGRNAAHMPASDGSQIVIDDGQSSKQMPIETSPSQIIVTTQENSPPHRSVVVEFITTDPHTAERYRASARPQVVVLDDAALLDTLAQMQRPAGLIRSQGRTWLTADVTDHRGG